MAKNEWLTSVSLLVYEVAFLCVYCLFLVWLHLTSWPHRKPGTGRKQHGGQWQCHSGYFVKILFKSVFNINTDSGTFRSCSNRDKSNICIHIAYLWVTVNCLLKSSSPPVRRNSPTLLSCQCGVLHYLKSNVSVSRCCRMLKFSVVSAWHQNRLKCVQQGVIFIIAN